MIHNSSRNHLKFHLNNKNNQSDRTTKTTSINNILNHIFKNQPTT